MKEIADRLRRTAEFFARLDGTAEPQAVIDLGNGVKLTRTPPSEIPDAVAYLRDMWTEVLRAAEKLQIRPQWLMLETLRAEGWSISRGSIRTPLRVDPLAEIPSSQWTRTLGPEIAEVLRGQDKDWR